MRNSNCYSITRRLAITASVSALLGLGVVAPAIQATPGIAKPGTEIHPILATTEGMNRYQDNRDYRQDEAPIMLAVGRDTRVERRHDAVENTADRIEDKQDFREGRRDCVGDGPDCRSDNRQEKRQDTVDRAEDRVNDRQERR